MHSRQKYSISPLIPVTNWNLRDYERYLNFKAESLRGKSVLDIGAGYAKFQKECQKLGIAVIALDYVYANPKKVSERFEKHLKVAENRKNKIAGINEALPFKENSFDVILSDCSSFHYLYLNYSRRSCRYRIAKRMFEEVISVLKPGGEARICEVRQRSKERVLYSTVLKEIAKKSDSEISWEFVTKMFSQKSTEGKIKRFFEEHLVLHKLK